MEHLRPLQSIPDGELLRRLAELTGQSRRAEADIVAHIAEVEERKLYARAASPSMFVYCMTVLHLSEAEAYLRIAAARASREHPMILAMLADGRLHLTAIAELRRHLTRENRDTLLARATHRSKRQIEELIAEIAPRPDVPAVMRRLPDRRTLPAAGLLGAPSHECRPMLETDRDPALELVPDGVERTEPMLRDEAAISHPAAASIASAVAASAFPVLPSVHRVCPVSAPVVQPLSPGRYKVQFTASSELHHKLERLRALMGSQVPDGDLGVLIEHAVTEKIERLEARRFARAKAPRQGPAETRRESSPSSRHIPAALRRAVSKRDGDRCRYVDEQGRRCPEQSRLEFHHRHPFALGGDHSLPNIVLMCRAHNAYIAECDYGQEAMARHGRPPGRDRRQQPSQTS